MSAAHLHQWSPELQGTLPHLQLGSGPTPVRKLEGLRSGPAELWLKDEGAFGDGAWGGNKVRKLEWLLPEAKRRGRRTILTFGGLGTNWGLATARYARAHGLHTALALVDQPVDQHVQEQLARLRDSGASLYFTHTKVRTVASLPRLLSRHSSGSRPPLLVPAGGSSPLGTLGYVEVAFEIAAQVHDGALPEPTHIVVPIGSGGTTAGLLLGLRLAGLRTRVLGVVVNDKLRLDSRTLLGLSQRSARLLRKRGANLGRISLTEDALTLTRDWLGPGYGHATPESQKARESATGTEGLELDLVYTAKAMAATREMNGAGFFGNGPVLFLNTNGPR